MAMTAAVKDELAKPKFLRSYVLLVGYISRQEKSLLRSSLIPHRALVALRKILPIFTDTTVI
jgi:hypothetical protein